MTSSQLDTSGGGSGGSGDTEYKLLIDEKMLRANVEIRPTQKTLLRVVKVVKFVVLFASAVAQWAVLGIWNIFNLFVYIDTNFRTGPVDAPEQLPSAVITHQWLVNSAAFFAAATAFAAIGTLLAILVDEIELNQIRRGVDAFLWVSLFFSQIILFLGIAMVCGISDILVLLGVIGLVGGWIGILLLGNYLNSHAHMNALLQTKEYFMYGFLWMFLGLFLLLNLILGLALGFETANGSPVVHILAPIGAFVLYLPIPIVITLHYRRQFFSLAISSVTALYVVDGIFMLIVPWLAHIAAATDGLTEPS